MGSDILVLGLQGRALAAAETDSGLQTDKLFLCWVFREGR